MKFGYVVLSNQNRINKKQSPKLDKIPWKKEYQRRRQQMNWKLQDILRRKGYHNSYHRRHDLCRFRAPKANEPILYNESIQVFDLFVQEQNRLARYFGGAPKFRKMGRMDKVYKKQLLGFGPKKSVISNIFQKIDSKAALYGKYQCFAVLKALLF